MPYPCALGARRSVRAALLLASTLLLILPTPGTGQVLRGRVTEDRTDEAIVNAEVRVLDQSGETTRQVVTDSLGEFRIDIPDPGTFVLHVRRLGYAPLSSPAIPLERGEEVEVEVRMSPDAVPLEPVVVVGRRHTQTPQIREFYERAERMRSSGWGTVFTREDIERLRPVRASFLLHMVPARARCPYEIYLDGLPVAGADELDSFIMPQDMEGMEIYKGFANIPPEFYRPGMCGLVLVWTRMDTEGRPLTWTRVFIALGLGALFFGITQAF